MYKTHAQSDGSQTYAFRFEVKLFYWLTSPGPIFKAWKRSDGNNFWRVLYKLRMEVQGMV
jgi:hypothetical protein